MTGSARKTKSLIGGIRGTKKTEEYDRRIENL